MNLRRGGQTSRRGCRQGGALAEPACMASGGLACESLPPQLELRSAVAVLQPRVQSACADGVPVPSRWGSGTAAQAVLTPGKAHLQRHPVSPCCTALSPTGKKQWHNEPVDTCCLFCSAEWQPERTLSKNYAANRLLNNPNDGFGRNNADLPLKSKEEREAAQEETFSDDDGGFSPGLAVCFYVRWQSPSRCLLARA